MFFEVECHTLIGVATVWLECLYQNVPLDYSAPIISQQGEVCGRLSVEIKRLQGKYLYVQGRRYDFKSGGAIYNGGGGPNVVKSDEQENLIL